MAKAVRKAAKLVAKARKERKAKRENLRVKRANQATAHLKLAQNMPLPQAVLRVERVLTLTLLRPMVVVIAEQQTILQTTVDDLRDHLVLTSLNMILMGIHRAGKRTLGGMSLGMNRGMRAGTKQIQLLITALGIRV